MFLKSSGVLVLMTAALNVLGVLAAATPEIQQFIDFLQGFQPCPEDGNINQCLINSGNLLLTKAPMESFVLEQVNFHFDSSLIRGEAEAHNVTTTGFMTKDLDKLKYERQGYKLKLMEHFHIPKIHIKGQYKVKLTSLPIFNTKGSFDIFITDVDMVVNYLAELSTRDGHTFMKLKNFTVDPDPKVGDMHISATGLNEFILQFINNNWRSIYKSVIETNTWKEMLIQYANAVLSSVPFDNFITNSKI